MWATDFVCGCVRSNLPWAHESRFQTSLDLPRQVAEKTWQRLPLEGPCGRPRTGPRARVLVAGSSTPFWVSARSRRLVSESVSLSGDQPSHFVPVEYRRAAFLLRVLKAAHRMRRVRVDDVADHQPVQQHPQGRQVLLHKIVSCRRKEIVVPVTEDLMAASRTVMTLIASFGATGFGAPVFNANTIAR